MTKARLYRLLVFASLIALCLGGFLPNGMNDGGWWI